MKHGISATLFHLVSLLTGRSFWLGAFFGMGLYLAPLILRSY